MTPFLNQFAFMSSEQHERPYLTFPVAIETGALTNPDDKAKVIDTSLGVILANGHIPNAQGAGLVDLGDEIIAFDHVAIDVEADDKIRITNVEIRSFNRRADYGGRGYSASEQERFIKICGICY